MKRVFLILASVGIIIGCVLVIINAFNRVSNRIQSRVVQNPLKSGIREVAMATDSSLSQAHTPLIEPFGKATMKILETGYHHTALFWSDNELWFQPWLIQRSTKPEFVNPHDLKNNQAADNTDSGTFRWLGINANNYVDLDDLQEATDYYYRVATVTNMSDYRRTGASPKFSDWIFGKVTTDTLPEKRKRIYNVTEEPYGAIPGDGLNDYQAVEAAYQDARKAGGGIVYFPSGNYDLWPEHKAVEIKNGIPTVRDGKSVPDALFTITGDNLTFLGEEDEYHNPTTFIKLYLWGKVPATKWLEIVSRDGSVRDVRRYHLFVLRNVENFTLRNLDIDGGAIPVDTGKEWYSLDQKRYQWDISNKLIATWDNQQAKNIIVDNVDTRSWRGEVYYNGGGSEKMLLKNGSVSQTNSSSVSGSFDLELVNMTIRDSANSSIESALFANRKSAFSRLAYNQNHIARGCTFIGLDQSDKGVMKDLPGDKKAFNGWLVFNQEGTYQTVTDSTFRNHIQAAYGPWYECRNAFLYNSTFQDPAPGSSNIFYTWTEAKRDYQLGGGFSEVLWLDNELVLSKGLSKNQTVFYSQPGRAAFGNESPWIWEGFHIANVSDKKLRIERFWVDTWWLDKGREQALFEDFTKEDSISFSDDYIYNTKPQKINPAYRNFFR